MKNVDRAQLERWAYGRSTTPEEYERASLAADELRRRAAVERERAELAATEAGAVSHGEVDDTVGEQPEPLTDEERRYRRRMLATGLAGVTAAALALVGGVAVLSQPNPDPLAIFETEETQLDRNWTQRLESWGFGPFIAGPRTIELADERVIIVARVSNVPDGRSTSWDPYCLFFASPTNTGDGSWGLSSECTYPEKFEREGLTLPDRPSASGDGFDTAIWGPSGEPRYEQNLPLDDSESSPSIIDILANPLFGFEQVGDVGPIIHDPDRLLMGPHVAYDAPSIADDPVVVQMYLLDGLTETAEPELCIRVTHPDGDPATACTPLSSARENGIFVVMAIADENWIVSVDAAGVVNAQQAQVAIPD